MQSEPPNWFLLIAFNLVSLVGITLIVRLDPTACPYCWNKYCSNTCKIPKSMLIFSLLSKCLTTNITKVNLNPWNLQRDSHVLQPVCCTCVSACILFHDLPQMPSNYGYSEGERHEFSVLLQEVRRQRPVYKFEARNVFFNLDSSKIITKRRRKKRYNFPWESIFHLITLPTHKWLLLNFLTHNTKLKMWTPCCFEGFMI